MVRILTENSHTTFKSLFESIYGEKKIDFYIMPLETKKFSDDSIVLSYIEGEEVKFIKAKSSDIGNDFFFAAGQRLTMSKNSTGKYSAKSVPKWKEDINFNDTVFSFGQSIFVKDSLNRDITKELCKKFEKKNNAISFRVIIGGSLGDSLYHSNELEDNTITCDASAPISVQFKTLYTAITKALALAYEGKDVIFALDSMTRLTNSLTGMYPNSHTLPGGVPFNALDLTSNIFKLAGSYNTGTLTVIGICNFNNADRATSTIYQELKNSANALAIMKDTSSFFGEPVINSSTTTEIIKSYPYFTILGKRFHY